MALEIPTLAQLVEQAKQDMEVETAGGLTLILRMALAYALAGLAYGRYLALRFLSLQLFVDTASTAFKLLWASIYGLEPNPATPAVGPVQLTGVDGTLVSIGQVVQRNSDGALYTATTGGTVLASEVSITVQADAAGSVGNAAAAVAFTVVSPPAGIDTEALSIGDGLVNGFDVETPASLGDRTLEKIRAPAISGAAPDYEVWAREANVGVAAAYATDAYAGIGTVLVIIAQQYDPTDPGGDPTPSAALITEVEDYIAPRRPAGLHLVSVQPPVLQPLDPFIELEPDTTDIRDAVSRSLALALSTVRPGGVAYYDDLVTAINRAAGEEHHRLWTFDGAALFGPYNTDVGDTSLMTLGNVTWAAPP